MVFWARRFALSKSLLKFDRCKQEVQKSKEEEQIAEGSDLIEELAVLTQIEWFETTLVDPVALCFVFVLTQYRYDTSPASSAIHVIWSTSIWVGGFKILLAHSKNCGIVLADSYMKWWACSAFKEKKLLALILPYDSLDHFTAMALGFATYLHLIPSILLTPLCRLWRLWRTTGHGDITRR